MAKKKATGTEPTLQLQDVPASIAGYAVGPQFYDRLVRDFPNETLGEDGIEAMLEDARTALGKDPGEIMANAIADWPQFVVSYRAWLEARRGKRAVLEEAAKQGFVEVVDQSQAETREVERSRTTCAFSGPQDEDPCTRAEGYCLDDTLEFWTARVDASGEADAPEPRVCEHCGEQTTAYLVTPTEQVFCLDGEACRERKRLQEEKSKAEGKRIEKVIEQHRVKLTTEEMKALADRTAENLRRKADLEQQKAQSTKSYAQKIGEVDAELHKDGALYREGHEMRDVECQIVKDYKTGWVTTIRLDTMEETHRRRLRHDEAQVPLPIGEATPGDLAAANIGGTFGTNPHPDGEKVEEHTPGDEPVVDDDDTPTAFELAMDEAAAKARLEALGGERVAPDCYGGPIGLECGEGASLCAFYAECSEMAGAGVSGESIPRVGDDAAEHVQGAA
ncbi:hypothetical protein SAMN04488503_2211 [Humidesulfovibrio mexicanus]|uniref:Uncharacterized protein n=1 Tax=Humidesulfovibrio mexicanus TaxID=147047 RepID=A0A239ATN5_9BACT|nr:hypothetical protein [Humidesulfovibrio mexicanus]SNR98920.1 hypothetical protein SAMN04488503_2211 [Humidesulfovibrio mexicanus]